MDADRARAPGLLARPRAGRPGIAATTALDAGDPRPLGRALGEGRARAGSSDWRAAPDSCLALVILLDQFPRNMFRDDARAFASDARALAVAKTAILHGQDQRVDAARAAVLLHAAHAFRASVQPGPVGAAVPAELRPRASCSATPGRTARSSAASGASPSATPRSGARARRRRSPSSPRAATGPCSTGSRPQAPADDSERQRRRGTGEKRDGIHDLRRRRDRRRARRLRRGDPRGAARPQDRGDRARAPRRHLPQLGLHPDQGAAALLGDLPPDAPRQGVRPQGRERRLRHRRRGQALARRGQAALRRRRLPDEEEQDRRGHGRGEARGQGQDHRQDRQGHRGDRGQVDHPRHRRPRPRPARARGRRQAGLELQARAGAAAHAEEAPRHRLRRHRHRVRELLQHARRRDDGGRGAAAHPPRRGRGDLGLRQEAVPEAEDDDPRRRDGQEARPRRRQGDRDHRAGRQDHHRRLRHGDLRRRHRRQRREPRPRGGRA